MIEGTLAIQSDSLNAREVQEKIIGLLKDRCCEDKSIFHVRLALEEALMNAIKHGNQGDPDKPVTIQYQLESAPGHQVYLQVVIADQGPGFDYQGLPDPTLPENLSKPSGRGVLLMKAFMDNVHYNQVGNTVTMIKYLHTTCQPLTAPA